MFRNIFSGGFCDSYSGSCGTMGASVSQSYSTDNTDQENDKKKLNQLQYHVTQEAGTERVSDSSIL